MKKIFRKNHMIITALALMIAAAGYISYTQSDTAEEAVETASEEVADTYDISDEDIVAEIFTDTEADSEEASADVSEDGENGSSENGTSEDPQKGDTDDSGNGTDDSPDGDADASGDTDVSETGTADVGETVMASTGTTVDFASQVKLDREQVRSKNKETLLEIINNTSLTDAQKQDAVDAMIAMTDVAERENAAEILLRAKGFTDVVVSITDDTADVVLNMGDVTDAKRAQAEDIVRRKTGISAENIVITPISAGADS